MGGFWKFGLIASLLFVTLSGFSCTSRQNLDSQIDSVAAPYRFNIVRWELVALVQEVRQSLSVSSDKEAVPPDDVNQYFASVEQEKALKPALAAINSGDRQGDRSMLENEMDQAQARSLAYAGDAEATLQRQISDTLSESGIYNPLYPLIDLKVGFPPVSFKLEEPLYLLVVSPRDRIERIRNIMLRQDISLTDIEYIESRIEQMGFSSLVVQLGGYAGVYPTFVTNQADLRFTIDAAIEEWVHQYLAFKPLGFKYVLHLSRIINDPGIVGMNETVAGIVSREIGASVYAKYYENYSQPSHPAPPTRIDFNKEMQNIRKQVDVFLAGGEVGLAEQFMNNQREYLASQGYYIRKLNQAYFAFYGSYADTPGSVDPIGAQLDALRQQSGSLSQFLELVSGMTSREELAASIR